MKMVFDKFTFGEFFVRLDKTKMIELLSSTAFDILKNDMLSFAKEYNLGPNSDLLKFIEGLEAIEVNTSYRFKTLVFPSQLNILELPKADRQIFVELFKLGVDKGLREFSYEPDAIYIKELDEEIKERTINAKKYKSNAIINGIDDVFWGSKHNLINNRANVYTIRKNMILSRDFVVSWLKEI